MELRRVGRRSRRRGGDRPGAARATCGVWRHVHERRQHQAGQQRRTGGRRTVRRCLRQPRVVHLPMAAQSRCLLRRLPHGSSCCAARTCGGVALDPAGVDGFVAELQPLLREGTGVALFDQEGGWPWGLEQRLRASAAQRGLHLYVRRGPFLTNFGYVLSAAPLADDLSGDPQLPISSP